MWLINSNQIKQPKVGKVRLRRSTVVDYEYRYCILATVQEKLSTLIFKEMPGFVCAGFKEEYQSRKLSTASVESFNLRFLTF